MRKEVTHNLTEKPLGLVYRNMLDTSDHVLQKKDVYRAQLARVDQLRQSYQQDKLLPDQFDRALKPPRERRREIEEVKRNVQAYRDFKDAHAMASKRDRLVKTGWRNGITGIDSVFDPNTHFYKQQQVDMVEREHDRRCIQERNIEGTFSRNPHRCSQVQGHQRRCRDTQPHLCRPTT